MSELTHDPFDTRKQPQAPMSVGMPSSELREAAREVVVQHDAGAITLTEGAFKSMDALRAALNRVDQREEQ